LLHALESMPDLFSKFGGHAQAAGLTLHAARVGEFRERFNHYAASLLTPDDFHPRLAVDAVAGLSDLNGHSVAEILHLGPFGHQNPPPLLAAMGVTIEGEPVLIKEKHLRVRVSQNGRSLVMKAWNFAGRISEFSPGRPLDIAFRLEDDAYSAARGYAPWQAVVKDVRPAIPCGASPR
jgi:single-stranded-DNA-specific exonuclease